MSGSVSAPLDYRLVDTPEHFAEAAQALAGGRGPFAVDTERASSFRYGDRAFLVQVFRRDAGTFLIAPEGHRRAVQDILGPVLNGQEWIIHAAGEDLRSLAQLGLYPGVLFDTELAARIAGFERPNLAAMVREFIGVELEKGHGQENWSTTPLPKAWQEYAALDVAYLCDLAEALTEHLSAHGKLDFAVQEFAHLATSTAQTHRPKTWRETKGVGSLRSSAHLQVARALWQTRDDISKQADRSPGRVLSNHALVTIARAEPSTAKELSAAVQHERMPSAEARRWQRIVDEALLADQSTWPQPLKPDPATPPSKSSWERIRPSSWHMLQIARESIELRASELSIQPSVLLAPATLKHVVWHSPSSALTLDTHAAARRLLDAGARPWQAELTAPLISHAHAASHAVGSGPVAKQRR